MKQLLLTTLYFVSVITFNCFSQKQHELEGRWDLTLENFNGKQAPSWLEVRHSGYETLVGRFVFAFGSARPVSEIKTFDNKFTFTIPRQWEPVGSDMVIHGELKDDKLKGTLLYTDGSIINWTGVKAPTLPYTADPKWEKTIALFNGKDLNGWHADQDENQWIVTDGILTSPKSGANLISDEKFTDFMLEAEFRYPKNGNSGIYLRGRYEVQVADNHGLEPSDIYFGGVYGFVEPNENAAKPAGEWQRYEITLIGNRVTVIANGKTVIHNQTIPGITGGALDSNEGEAGPIMIQGDHQPVEFRKFNITPIKNPTK